jgi:hypothetical protein
MDSHQASAGAYADKWFRSERQIVRDYMTTERALRTAALQRAAGYFKIARNMPRKYDTAVGLDRLGPVLSILEEPEYSAVDAASLRDRVRSLRRRLAVAYGGKDLLSAATKLLWLSHKSAVIIFDSQARAALGTRAGDYEAYLDQWHIGFAVAREEVLGACRVLAERQPDAALGISREEWKSTVLEEWFMMRVFDMQLWQPQRADDV